MNSFLAIDEHYAHFHQAVPAMVGWQAANAAWVLKDSAKLGDAELDLCRKIQAALETANPGAKLSWRTRVSENHALIDPAEWIEHSLRLGALRPEQETGYSDLDYNFNVQQTCGTQLEEFHRGTWAKVRLEELCNPKNFEELLPFENKWGTPLPHLIDTLDRDLSAGVFGGLRHPYNCSIGVGAICLVITDQDGEREIALIRRAQSTDIARGIERLKDDITERYKALIDTIKEYQGHLRDLPQGWPNDRVHEIAQEWSNRRFLGDNGLVGSDFFDGHWLKESKSMEIRSGRDLAPASTEVNFAQQRLERQTQAGALEAGAPQLDLGAHRKRKKQDAKDAAVKGFRPGSDSRI